MSDELALLAANEAYYDAFNARDDDAMAALWAQENVSCVHPGWPPLFGRRAVLSSYEEIFHNPRQQKIVHSSAQSVIDGECGRVICLETVGDAALVATNWHRLVEGRWLLVHHQASPLAFDASTSDRRLMH
ncbi:MAG TPA: nuclear transport factor 2 family protein [Methylocystis sp.]|nr:nuclear transport factor 2 family protein [Methylocystis sp.]